VRRLSIARIAAVGSIVLVVAALMLLGATGMLPGSAERAVAAVPSVVADGRIPARALDDPPDGTDESAVPPYAAPRVNLNGEEVSPAIATYGIDREGNLFEVHSPHTEEPKLGAPIG